LRFAVHGPGSSMASPRSHGVPRRDVRGRVHVRISDETTGGACENGLALARIRIYPPARRAALARVRGINSFDPIRRLFFEQAHRQAPSGTENTPVKACFRPDIPPWVGDVTSGCASHSLDIEILNTDHIESPRQVGAGLLSPVLAPIGLPRFKSRDRRFDPPAPVRTAARPGKPALQPQQAVSLGDYEAWGLKQFPGRQGSRHHYAPVNPNHLPVARIGDRFRYTCERDVPPASGITRHVIRLHPIGHRAGPTKPHPAHLRDPHIAYVTRDATHIPLSAAQSDDAEALVAPGLPPRWPPMRPIEEVRHGLPEIAQGLLLHRLTTLAQPRVFRAGGSELPRLLKVARRGFPARPPVLVLFNSKVPYIPGVRAVLRQDRFLIRRRCKPKPCYTNIISNHNQIWCLLSDLNANFACSDLNDQLGS
jgi:hypothetical protein